MATTTWVIILISAARSSLLPPRPVRVSARGSLPSFVLVPPSLSTARDFGVVFCFPTIRSDTTGACRPSRQCGRSRGQRAAVLQAPAARVRGQDLQEPGTYLECIWAPSGSFVDSLACLPSPFDRRGSLLCPPRFGVYGLPMFRFICKLVLCVIGFVVGFSGERRAYRYVHH